MKAKKAETTNLNEYDELMGKTIKELRVYARNQAIQIPAKATKKDDVVAVIVATRRERKEVVDQAEKGETPPTPVKVRVKKVKKTKKSKKDAGDKQFEEDRLRGLRLGGQKVNTDHSGGLNVGQSWDALFQENENAWKKYVKAGSTAAKKKAAAAIRTDEEIAEEMLRRFPDRPSRVFHKVNMVRGRYNRGTNPNPDNVQSFRYYRSDDGTVLRKEKIRPEK